MKPRSAVALALSIAVVVALIWQLGKRAVLDPESSGAIDDTSGTSATPPSDELSRGQFDVDEFDGQRRSARSSSHGVVQLDARLLLVNERSREPIAGARVRWWNDDTRGSGTSDEDGSVAVPKGKLVAWASAPGFQDWLYVDDTTRESTIALPLAAGLELSFRSADGATAGVDVQALLNVDEAALAGVPGVQERVLRKLAQSENMRALRHVDLEACAGPIALSLDGWKATSDETGRATWRSLPAGTWRWHLLSNHPVTIAPAFETAAIDFRDGQTVWRSTPSGTSGAFELVAGATLRIDVDVAAPTSLRGRVISADDLAAAGVRVLLRRVEQHADPLGLAGAVGQAAIVSEAHTSVDGAFAFERLQPGSFELTAVQASAEQRFDFAVAQAEVTEGEQRDVGDLRFGGVALSGRVDLVDASTGSALDAETVIAKPGEELRVSLAWVSPHACEQLSIVVGQPFELRGLEPGNHSASVNVHTPSWRIKSNYTVVGDRPRVTFDVPGFDRQLVFAIALIRSAHLRLRGRVGEPSRNPWSVQGKLAACGGSAATDFSQTLQKVDLDTSVDLPPGDYWVYAKASTHEGVRTCALQRVNLAAEGAECTLVFGPAVDITGVAVSHADGAALADKLILAAPVDAPNGSWFFDARANERGEFTLRSLPPNIRIRFTKSADVIDTGAAGVFNAVVYFGS